MSWMIFCKRTKASSCTLMAIHTVHGTEEIACGNAARCGMIQLQRPSMTINAISPSSLAMHVKFLKDLAGLIIVEEAECLVDFIVGITCKIFWVVIFSRTLCTRHPRSATHHHEVPM